jgi:hypothetical protein
MLTSVILTNVILTNLLLFYLLIRVARFTLGQPACAGSFSDFGGGKSAIGPSLAWSPEASLGQSRQQPFAKITTIAAVREASSLRSVRPIGQKDVCHDALVDREALDAYFAQMAKPDNVFNDTLSQSSVAQEWPKG